MPNTYLEPEGVAQLEEAAYNMRDKLLIRLLFRLGCRISEVLGIGEEEIDFRLKTVTIQHLKVRLKLFCPQCHTRLAKTTKFCPGCGNKVDKAVTEGSEHRRQRVLPIDQDTLFMLRDYIDQGGLVEANRQRLLFDIKRRRAADIVSECAVRAGLGYLVNPETGELRGISPHRLRDAFAVMAVKVDDSGDGLRLLQEHLGHQNITTTMRYRKVSGEEHRDWFEKLWK